MMRALLLLQLLLLSFSSVASSSLRLVPPLSSFPRGGAISSPTSAPVTLSSLLGSDSNVVQVSIPEEKHFPVAPNSQHKVAFPLTLSPTEGKVKKSLEGWVYYHRAAIDKLLPIHGAILFRGFDLPTPTHFSSLVQSGFSYEEQPYIGGNAVRTIVAPRVFTSNESPPSQKIPFHHEMAQVPRFPTKVFFYCQTPSSVGGETPIVLSSIVSDAIERSYPALFRRFKDEGVKYIRTMPTEDDPTSALGRGWCSTYQTRVKEVAEQEMAKDGVEWEWLPNGDLKTVSKRLEAVRVYDGKNVFFNQVVAAYSGWNDKRNVSKNAIVFGVSGEKLPEKEMDEIIAMMDQLAVAFKWQQGDVLLIDNRLAMHSRKPFEKPRVVLASLCR